MDRTKLYTGTCFMLVCIHGTVTAKNAVFFLILTIIVNQNGYYKSLKNRTQHYCYEGCFRGATSKIIHASQQE